MKLTSGSMLSGAMGRLLGLKYAPPIVALGPWGLGVAIALVAPDDILSRASWLLGYVDWFSNIFPYMQRTAAKSTFPEVTLFFHAMMWTIAPVWLGLLFKMPPQKIVSYRKQKERRWLLLFAYPLFLFLLIYVPHFLMFDSPDLSRLEQIMSYSRMGLGVAGTVTYAGGTVAFIYLVVIWIRRIPLLYFNKTIRG